MHVPEKKVDDEDEEDEFADIYDDDEAAAASKAVIDCICGTKMALVRAKDAYKRCNTVYCDICGEQFLESKVWHCPLGYDAKHHANGYDVCTKCASKKKVDAKEESEEHEIEIDEDMKSELDSTTSETESAVVVEKMEDVEKEEDRVEIEKFPFVAELAQIKEIMALDTAERDDEIKAMLLDAKGDISRVVPLLFQ